MPSTDLTRQPRPNITVFLCDKCCTDIPPWTGDDRPRQIGAMRFKCAAEVGPVDVRQALETGSDGVLILGCLMADCLSGQDHVRALRAIYENQVLLRDMGLNLQRLRQEWVAPCEIVRLDQVLEEFTQDLSKHLAQLRDQDRGLEAEG